MLCVNVFYLQLFQNVPVVFRDREDFIKIGQEMSQRFETLYEEKVCQLRLIIILLVHLVCIMDKLLYSNCAHLFVGDQAGEW